MYRNRGVHDNCVSKPSTDKGQGQELDERPFRDQLLPQAIQVLPQMARGPQVGVGAEELSRTCPRMAFALALLQ